MKNKKIVHLQAFLFATIIACLLWGLLCFLTQQELFSLSSFNAKFRLGFVIYLYVFFYLFFIVSEKHAQISIIAYFDSGCFVEYGAFDSPPSKYSEILEKLSDDEWDKICQKYDELVYKARKAEKAKKQQILNEYDTEIQEKINKIKGNCDERC